MSSVEVKARHSLTGGSGLETVLVGAQMGELVTSFVLLTVNPGSEEKVLRCLAATDGVKAAYRLYGLYDIIAKVEAESKEEVKDLVQEKIRRIREVRSTLTLTAV